MTLLTVLQLDLSGAGPQGISGRGLARTTGKASAVLTVSLTARGQSSTVGKSQPLVAMVLAAQSSARTMGRAAANVGVLLVAYGRGGAQTFGRAAMTAVLNLTAVSGSGLSSTFGRAIALLRTSPTQRQKIPEEGQPREQFPLEGDE